MLCWMYNAPELMMMDDTHPGIQETLQETLAMTLTFILLFGVIRFLFHFNYCQAGDLAPPLTQVSIVRD